MACLSLEEVQRECGAAGIMGGADDLLVMSYNDAEPVGLDGKVYAITAGVVSEIGRKTTKKFVKVSMPPETGGLAEALTANIQNGSSFFTQTLTLVMQKLSVVNRDFVLSVMNQPIIAIVRTPNGKYYAGGLGGRLQLATADGGTGIAAGDLQGRTLTFTGNEDNPFPEVDAALIPDLIVAAP